MWRLLRFPLVASIALFLTILTTAPANALTPRMRFPFVVSPQLNTFFNSSNFSLRFQPLGGGARLFTLNNGAMTSQLRFQPLGGGARVITFNNGTGMARLTFQPLGGGAQVLSFSTNTNITAPQLLFLSAALNHRFAPNASKFSGWGNAGYGMGGFGMGGLGMGGYGNSGYGGSPYISIYSSPGAGSAPIYSMPQPSQSNQGSVFDVLGLPTQNGQLVWPLGLRILPPDQETQALRRSIEADVIRAVQQSAGNQDASPNVKQTHEDIRQLRRSLNEKGYKLPERTVSEAQRFLDRLDRAADNAGSLNVAGGAAGY